MPMDMDVDMDVVMDIVMDMVMDMVRYMGNRLLTLPHETITAGIEQPFLTYDTITKSNGSFPYNAIGRAGDIVAMEGGLPCVHSGALPQSQGL